MKKSSSAVHGGSPLSLLEESYGGLWCGVEEWLADGRGWLRRESSGSRLLRGLVARRRVVADTLSFWRRMWKSGWSLVLFLGRCTVQVVVGTSLVLRQSDCSEAVVTGV